MSEPTKNTKPNLFEYASKELSQDAMICWLIDWAGQRRAVAPEDEELRRCGRRFVCALLNHKRGGKDPVELGDEFGTKILRQERSIDVLARIDGEHVLLIEDKTGTKDHGKQLQRYYDDVLGGGTKFGEVQERNLYPVYLKTGNQALADDRRIEAIKPYKVFDRENFLNALNEYKGHNSILLDFRQHLRKWEDKTNSYAEWTRDAGRECWCAWEGFYRLLEEELDNGTRRSVGWDYVPNPSGGFRGFYWCPSENDELYLQIEAHPGKDARLCFKVDADGEDSERQEQMKWQWSERVQAAGRQQVVRPKVMRIGNYMTVAWWKDDWMAFGKEGKLDVPGTVKNLKRAEAVLKRAVEA